MSRLVPSRDQMGGQKSSSCPCLFFSVLVQLIQVFNSNFRFERQVHVYIRVLFVAVFFPPQCSYQI